MEKISGIWENSYVCELGIMEHIREVTHLYETWQELKALRQENNTTSKTRRQWKKELADLYLILEKFLDEDTIKQRIERFREKAEEDLK